MEPGTWLHTGNIVDMDRTSTKWWGRLELNPQTELAMNWHVEIIAAKLTAVRHGKIPRLIINRPPRHLKSLLASIMLTAKQPEPSADARRRAATSSQRTCMGLFLSSGCFGFAVSSLFGAGRRFFVPSPGDQVRGARGRGQGTEPLAQLGGLPPSVACVSQRLDA